MFGAGVLVGVLSMLAGREAYLIASRHALRAQLEQRTFWGGHRG